MFHETKFELYQRQTSQAESKAKSHIYDIENFFIYAYSEATRTNFNLQENTQRSIQGGAGYGNITAHSKVWTVQRCESGRRKRSNFWKTLTLIQCPPASPFVAGI